MLQARQHGDPRNCVFTRTRFECTGCRHVMVYCRVHADRVTVYGNAVRCAQCGRFSGRKIEGVLTYRRGAKITPCTWASARDREG